MKWRGQIQWREEGQMDTGERKKLSGNVISGAQFIKGLRPPRSFPYIVVWFRFTRGMFINVIRRRMLLEELFVALTQSNAFPENCYGAKNYLLLWLLCRDWHHLHWSNKPLVASNMREKRQGDQEQHMKLDQSWYHQLEKMFFFCFKCFKNDYIDSVSVS